MMYHRIMRVVRYFCALAVSLSLCEAGRAAPMEVVGVGNTGNLAELSGSGPGSSGEARLTGAVDYNYWIGTYEVTAGQYAEFLNAVASSGDPYGLYSELMWTDPRGCRIERLDVAGAYSYTVDANWANRPVNYVSWGDAARFANWLHNDRPDAPAGPGTTEDGSYALDGATTFQELMGVVRADEATWVIPSEDEWYKAAYHRADGDTGNYFDYPTSSDTAPSFVADDASVPEVDPGNVATYDGDGGVDGIGSPYFRTVVGEHENSPSPYGTYDQAGNVWEWNESAHFGAYRGVRGGTYTEGSLPLHAASRGFYALPTNELDNAGFRVAKIPEPASALLMALGGAALAARRRRRARPGV